MMTSALRELRRANLATMARAERPAGTAPVSRWWAFFRARHGYARGSW
ncbi:MAG: hypothetical protein PHR30_09915 [Gallionellaceae bacterium]|nr:hypothetical protein [Gallionellaceae bacterium]